MRPQIGDYGDPLSRRSGPFRESLLTASLYSALNIAGAGE